MQVLCYAHKAHQYIFVDAMPFIQKWLRFQMSFDLISLSSRGTGYLPCLYAQFQSLQKRNGMQMSFRFQLVQPFP